MISIFRTFIILVILAGSSVAAEQRYTVPIGDSPQKGPENARVTMIEFIDFQ
jgi:hypothetical protein